MQTWAFKTRIDTITHTILSVADTHAGTHNHIHTHRLRLILLALLAGLIDSSLQVVLFTARATDNTQSFYWATCWIFKQCILRLVVCHKAKACCLTHNFYIGISQSLYVIVLRNICGKHIIILLHFFTHWPPELKIRPFVEYFGGPRRCIHTNLCLRQSQVENMIAPELWKQNNFNSLVLFNLLGLELGKLNSRNITRLKFQRIGVHSTTNLHLGHCKIITRYNNSALVILTGMYMCNKNNSNTITLPLFWLVLFHYWELTSGNVTDKCILYSKSKWIWSLLKKSHTNLLTNLWLPVAISWYTQNCPHSPQRNSPKKNVRTTDTLIWIILWTWNHIFFTS